jgi:hypothetical protein
MAIKVKLLDHGNNITTEFYDPLTNTRLSYLDTNLLESGDLTGLNLEGIVRGIRSNAIYVSEGHIGHKTYSGSISPSAHVDFDVITDKGYKSTSISLVNDGPGSLTLQLDDASGDLISVYSREAFTENQLLPYSTVTITNISSSATSYRLFCN